MNSIVKVFLGIGILIVIGLTVLFYSPENKSDSANKKLEQEKATAENKAIEQEKAFNESGQAKAIEKESDLWQVYEDKDAGFSIKYPGDVSLGDNKDGSLYKLSVESKKVDLLEDTMGFDKETAKANLAALSKGEYGKNVDWPIDESKKVVKIGNINAQDFVVFSRFEVCNVTFERKLYFFSKGYQVVITLTGPKKEIIANYGEYFKSDTVNCGEEKVWNFEKMKDFFNSLKSNSSSGVAQEWYNRFDKIVGTIEFNEGKAINEALLSGRWVSLDDTSSEIEFIGKKKIDYYQSQKMSEADYVIQGKDLTVTGDGEEFKYSIVELSDKSLVLTYLARGNTLKYKKK